MNYLPEELEKIIRDRNDLMKLEFLEEKNERKLVLWLIYSGFKEYPEFLKDKKISNKIFSWLAKPSSFKNFSNLPKISLGIWDSSKSLQRRWPYPNLNNFYIFWLKKNWSKINISLPAYKYFFQGKSISFNLIEYYFYEIFWLIRNPISVFTENTFGFGIDYFFANKLFGWKIQINVISALIYRELKTRVSQVKFGVLGVFIEPLGVMAVFLIIFSIIRVNRGPLDIFLFLGAGIVLFTLFADVAIRSSNGMSANEALFFYKPVKPIDTVIARTIVESGLYAIVFLAIIFGTFVLKQKFLLNDIALLFSAYCALVIFSFGLGLFLLVATFTYPSLIQFIPLAMRPLWFVSGVFISLSSLPQWLRPFVSWNPVLQAIEISRHAFTTEYIIDKSMISLSYLWSCAVISLTIGLWIYSINEEKLLTK